MTLSNERFVPTIKICGIRNAPTLRAMKALGVDHIGFVFAPSKRRVTPEEAGEMIRVLKTEGFQAQGKFKAAGVFVNPEWQELASVMAAAPLDIVQLHGQETPAYCRRVKETFGTEVFKAVPVPEDGLQEDVEGLISRLNPYKDVVDTFLLDTHDPLFGGGSGRTFSWEAIPPILEWTRSAGCRLIVAGGLHPGNVNHLVSVYRPDGVDVSSGVETDGLKDIVKISKFVERVKEA